MLCGDHAADFSDSNATSLLRRPNGCGSRFALAIELDVFQLELTSSTAYSGSYDYVIVRPCD